MLRCVLVFLCCPLILFAASVRADDDDDHNRDVTPIETFLIADVGYRMLQINRFDIDGDDVAPRLIPATSHGVAPGAQLGVRLWFVSFAVRGEVAFFNATQGAAFDDGQFRMYSLDGELALRLPLGRFHPYLLLGGGYSGLGGLQDVRLGRTSNEGSSHGGNVRGGVGFDVLVGRYGVFGLRGTLEGLFMSTKTPVRELLTDDIDTTSDAEQRAQDVDGSLGGYSAAVSLLAGVRI